MDDILEHLQHVLIPSEFVDVQEHWHEWKPDSDGNRDWPKHWSSFDIALAVNFN